MKIAVFETGEWEHDACLRLRPRHEIVCLREPLNDVTVASVPDAEIATTFIGSDLKGPLLRQLPKLRMIATRSTGYDISISPIARREALRSAMCPTMALHRGRAALAVMGQEGIGKKERRPHHGCSPPSRSSRAEVLLSTRHRRADWLPALPTQREHAITRSSPPSAKVPDSRECQDRAGRQAYLALRFCQVSSFSRA